MDAKKYKEIIDFVKTELEKIKDVEDERVKNVVSTVEDYIKKIELPTDNEKKTEEDNEEDDKEDNNEEEKTAEETTEKEEEKSGDSEEGTEQKKTDVEETSENAGEEKKEPAEKNTEDINKELSKAIAEKLNESALELKKLNDELDNAKKDLKAKEELISVYKNKVVELEKDLKVYKDAEALELKKAYNKKVNTLIELFKDLGIKKTEEEINSNFNESQIDKLISDLSVVKSPSNKYVRSTKVSQEMELTKYKPRENKNKEITLKDIMFRDV